jgi:(methylthio)acryloyl-CoA hydratase
MSIILPPTDDIPPDTLGVMTSFREVPGSNAVTDIFLAAMSPQRSLRCPGDGAEPVLSVRLSSGLETAAAAHIRVADETTFFALPEGTRGIFIGGGGSVRVARLIGAARMQDMMLTGRVLTADDAERYGIVQYVVPKGQQLAKAKELALTICKNAPLSNFAITNSLPRLQDMGYDDGLYFERMVAEYTRSPESITRLNQFLDKTAPRVRPGE